MNTDLQKQIETFSNFDRELVSGDGAKGVMAAIGAKSRDLYQVPVGDIHVLEGYNPRVHNRAYDEGVAALGEDIARLGFWQDKPLAGYIAKIDGKNVIVLQDGHRRFAAVQWAIANKQAPITTLPVVLKDKSQSTVDLTIALLHSNEGSPFTMYEKAVIAKRFKAFGWENKKIAEEMRCTTAFVGQLLDLAGAPSAIQELVKNGELSATAAMGLLKEHGEDAADVAQDMVETAKTKGKKATAKDALTPAQVKERNSKKVGFLLYKLVNKLFNDDKVVKAMPDEVYTELDALITEIEKKPKVKVVKEPKPPKAPKAAKAPKAPAVKKAPLAKKVAAAKKAPATRTLAPWDKPAPV